MHSRAIQMQTSGAELGQMQGPQHPIAIRVRGKEAGIYASHNEGGAMFLNQLIGGNRNFRRNSGSSSLNQLNTPPQAIVNSQV